jgi:hypothetical protein
MKARHVLIFIAALAIGASVSVAAAADQAPMQQFVIEREIPGADQMTPDQLREAAAKSNEVLSQLGPDIEWLHSYIAGDKLYCVYNARSASLIESHAEISGFPANRITPVSSVIDPGTANAKN